MRISLRRDSHFLLKSGSLFAVGGSLFAVFTRLRRLKPAMAGESPAERSEDGRCSLLDLAKPVEFHRANR